MEEILPKVEKIIIDDEVNNMINLLPLGNIDQKERNLIYINLISP
jgi:hypothetical protein